jgi:predicted alpha/beta hydrolase family esterase
MEIMKRIFIVHCWQGAPSDFWYPWLAHELAERGLEAHVPEMPDTNSPAIEKWISKLSEEVGIPDEETYFVGHSIGCQAVFRYLQSLSNPRVGGMLCVAGWFNLPSLETVEEKEIAGPWLQNDLNTTKLKKLLEGKLTAVFSTNDPHVPLTDADLFQEELGARVIIESGMGHYDSESTTELPIALEEILKIAIKK